jgi:tRNA-Thr(GGU) m(6)t(6)A37 methyltransferase TsaA
MKAMSTIKVSTVGTEYWQMKENGEMRSQYSRLAPVLQCPLLAVLYLIIQILAASGCTAITEVQGMSFKRIGIVRSPYTPEKKAPRQGALAPDVESLIVIDPEFEEGLLDIESFSHIIVLYAFDRSSGWTPLVKTPWEEKRHGVFATRSPRRPNPIGMTVVKLNKRSGSTLHVQGLDAFDGTIVLDLKPYVPKFDGIEGADPGWLKES